MGILDSIKCALIEVANLFIEHILNNVLSVITFIIGLLPTINFFGESQEMGEFGIFLGYFIPVGTMLQHFALLLGLLAIWYSYEYIMRWIKMIK